MHESEKWKWRRSVVSDSQRPHGLQPTRPLCAWDFPGKSTGVECHCLLSSPNSQISKNKQLALSIVLVYKYIYICMCYFSLLYFPLIRKPFLMNRENRIQKSKKKTELHITSTRLTVKLEKATPITFLWVINMHI